MTAYLRVRVSQHNKLLQQALYSGATLAAAKSAPPSIAAEPGR